MQDQLKPRLAQWARMDKRVKSWKDAYKEKSKHYRIHTDVPRFILELEIKPFLDALYQTYVDVFKQDFGLSGRGANKRLIRIFYGFENYAHNAEPGEVQDRGTPAFILGVDELLVYYDER